MTDDTPNPATLLITAYMDRHGKPWAADGIEFIRADDVALTPHAPAQAAIDELHAENDRMQSAFIDLNLRIDELRAEVERLKGEKQEQALQALSDDGQWIEHTGKLQAEVERLRKDAGRLAPTRIDQFDHVRDQRVALLARRFADSMYSGEDRARFAILTEQARALRPKVSSADMAILNEQAIQIQEVFDELDRITAEFGL